MVHFVFPWHNSSDWVSGESFVWRTVLGPARVRIRCICLVTFLVPGHLVETLVRVARSMEEKEKRVSGLIYNNKIVCEVCLICVIYNSQKMRVASCVLVTVFTGLTFMLTVQGFKWIKQQKSRQWPQSVIVMFVKG